MNNKDKAKTVLRSAGYDLLILENMTNDEIGSLADCFISNTVDGGHRYSIDRTAFYQIMELRAERLDEGKAVEEIEDGN